MLQARGVVQSSQNKTLGRTTCGVAYPSGSLDSSKGRKFGTGIASVGILTEGLQGGPSIQM